MIHDDDDITRYDAVAAYCDQLSVAREVRSRCTSRASPIATTSRSTAGAPNARWCGVPPISPGRNRRTARCRLEGCNGASASRCRSATTGASGFYLVTLRDHDAPSDRASATPASSFDGIAASAGVAGAGNEHLQRLQKGAAEPVHRRVEGVVLSTVRPRHADATSTERDDSKARRGSAERSPTPKGMV